MIQWHLSKKIGISWIFESMKPKKNYRNPYDKTISKNGDGRGVDGWGRR
jgi:hypothetical protein